jgi:hypothetical protein
LNSTLALDEYYQITSQWLWFFYIFFTFTCKIKNYVIYSWFMHVLSSSFYSMYLYKLYCCSTVQ